MSCHPIGVTMTAIGMIGTISEMIRIEITMTVETVAMVAMAAMVGIAESLRSR